jgi:hypothetical protein
MPTPTYTPLANTTLGSSASSITFSSISGSYRDLVLVISGVVNTGTAIYLRFNGDTGNNYSYVRMVGNGSTTSKASGTISAAEIGEMFTNEANIIAQVMDYSATDKHKSGLARCNASTNSVFGHAYRWANTAAITSMVVLTSGGTFNSGTTMALYGIAS